MDENPYQSPDAAAAAEDEDAQKRCRGPWSMTIIGLFAGGMIGATAGAIAAAVIALVAAIVVILSPGFMPKHYQAAARPPEDVVGFVAVGGFLGTMCGGLAGGILGPVRGRVAALSRERSRRKLVYLSGSLCAVAGGLFGTLGGAILWPGDLPEQFAWLAIGGLVGGRGVRGPGVAGRG